jgi:hypothetical protein
LALAQDQLWCQGNTNLQLGFYLQSTICQSWQAPSITDWSHPRCVRTSGNGSYFSTANMSSQSVSPLLSSSQLSKKCMHWYISMYESFSKLLTAATMRVSRTCGQPSVFDG